jgi:glycosyltransferase involved in cell wall biosynthesis
LPLLGKKGEGRIRGKASRREEKMAMRVALVHEWLTNMAGSERVILALHELYPDAPIYTSVYVPEEFPELARADVRTSFLQRVPGAKTKHQAFSLLRTVAFERFDLSDYDVVISSSHAEAKGVITRPEALHICYCYTPVRYYWSGYHHYLENPRFGLLNPIVKLAMPYMTNYLRLWDRLAADRVDRFVAISAHVARRIDKYYRRDADVIFPPVTTARLEKSDSRGDYFLMVGRIIPYKRADIVVDAFNQLGLPLKIAGTGPDMESMQKISASNIEFLGRVSDSQLSELYGGCIALVFPQEEDFGIVPLEAMAAGKPVIAYRAGGALETVIEGETGVFFDHQDVESLKQAVSAFDADRFKPERCREQALKFDVEIFKKEFKRFVDEAWSEYQERQKSTSSTKMGQLIRVPKDTKLEGEDGESTDAKRVV